MGVDRLFLRTNIDEKEQANGPHIGSNADNPAQGRVSRAELCDSHEVVFDEQNGVFARSNQPISQFARLRQRTYHITRVLHAYGEDPYYFAKNCKMQKYRVKEYPLSPAEMTIYVRQSVIRTTF